MSPFKISLRIITTDLKFCYEKLRPDKQNTLFYTKNIVLDRNMLWSIK